MERVTLLLIRLKLWIRLVMILKGLIVLLNLLTNQVLWLLVRNNLNLSLRRFRQRTMELDLQARILTMAISRVWMMLI
jgi:hypothetical protein